MIGLPGRVLLKENFTLASPTSTFWDVFGTTSICEVDGGAGRARAPPSPIGAALSCNTRKPFIWHPTAIIGKLVNSEFKNGQ